MSIIEYQNGTEKQFFEDLKYWSNACGELHHHGEFDIEEEQLPKELLRAYNELWTAGASSLCYLAEFKGEYRIALINEFDETYAKDIDTTMDVLYQHMKSKAEEYSSMDAFANAQIVIAQDMGLDCHEFVVLLPCDTSKGLFDRIINILKDVYNEKLPDDYLDLKMSVNEDVYGRMKTEFPDCLEMWNEECKKYNEATDEEIGECGENLTRFQVAVFGTGETIEEYLDDYAAYEALNKNAVVSRHKGR